MTTAYDFEAKAIDGGVRALADWRGRPLLIVNTASKCGFTPHYAGLQALHERYADSGLAVLGFPCDQFGHQEPGADAEIASFCASSYGVEFPMFAKIEVNGAGAHPLFAWLTREARGILGTRRIKWNFTKFLTDRAGRVVSRHAPATKPEALAGAIEALL